jgi:starch synthase (maltosyl-transferring)
MGFDVVYLPPIHPIGNKFSKRPQQHAQSRTQRPRKPLGHRRPRGRTQMAVHPDLGTLADFDSLVAEAKRLKLEIALDIAFQCSPDHPYVTEHPAWFSHRPGQHHQIRGKSSQKVPRHLPDQFRV